MSLFFADIKDDLRVSYEDLLSHINNPDGVCNTHLSNKFYNLFLQIIFSLVRGNSIQLIDDEEKIDIIYSSVKKTVSVESLEELQTIIRENRGRSGLTLFTSGTTGQPKRVDHSISSLTKRTHVSVKHRDDIWGFCYNPTHMAGIQVFFQALLNQNPIIRLFGLDNPQIYQSLEQFNITHISATPTFYRLLVKTDKVFPNAQRVTMGGEKFDTGLVEKLRGLFPNAHFRNIYASTEAGAIFESSGDVFEVKEDLRDKVKVVNDELVLHLSLLADKLDISHQGDWYHTGDLITVINEKPLKFKFKGRKNEMINVGGYKVNPSKVEGEINKIEGVTNCRVYSKENAVVGKIVCCDIVLRDKSLTEKKIRDKVKDELNDYEIPRFFKVVDQIEKTRTGKLKRT